MLFFLQIYVQMPTTVGILIFMSRNKFMLSWVEHGISFITSEPDLMNFILSTAKPLSLRLLFNSRAKGSLATIMRRYENYENFYFSCKSVPMVCRGSIKAPSKIAITHRCRVLERKFWKQKLQKINIKLIKNVQIDRVFTDHLSYQTSIKPMTLIHFICKLI